VGLVYFPDPGDLESLRVRNSPVFQALIAESRRVNPAGTRIPVWVPEIDEAIRANETA
jgi:hypothetical protein